MSGLNLAGRLLVATPLIADPIFERTVVLLLGQGDDGALGIVLNRPSDTPAVDLLPGWGARAARPAVMFIGGPVGADAVIGLGPGGAVDLNTHPDESLEPASVVRLFAGSAGWGAGQLEGEIAEGAWWVVGTEPSDVLASDPESLWRDVLRRQAQPLSWFARFPRDPSVN